VSPFANHLERRPKSLRSSRTVAVFIVTRLSWRASLSTPQRSRITHISLVELHVLLRQVRRINHRSRRSQVQIDVQVKFFCCDRGAQLLETGPRRLTSPQTPQNPSAPRRAVTHVHLLLDHPRRAVAQRIHDPAPVGITAMPTCLY